MIRCVGVGMFFGGAWWALLSVGGSWFRSELTGPIALVWWLLLVVLPLAICACILIPERLRTIRLIEEVPTEVHNHYHVHNNVTVNYTDNSTTQTVNMLGGAAAQPGWAAAWRSGNEVAGSRARAVGGSTRAAIPAAQPRVVPGKVVRNLERS